MAKIYSILLSLFILANGQSIQTGYAQVIGNCEPGEAEAYLDVNNVRAAVYNGGNLFWRGSGGKYKVPKQGNAPAIFAANIWIGGIVDDEIRFSGETYGMSEFWPGPFDEMGNPPENCLQYDRIYVLYRDSLRLYEETGIPTHDLINWPVDIGASVIDGDGIPENYNLEGGDRPALVGDQMLWWVMNDAGNEKKNPMWKPISIEVQVTAFAFDDFPIYPMLRDVLQHSTFFRFRLIYRGVSPLEKAWFGLFVDADLGQPSDDYIGSDSLLGRD